MDEQKLNWQQKDKPNVTKLLDQINEMTKQVVSRELKEIHAKIDVLHQIGLIKDDEAVRKMKDKMKAMGIEKI